MCICALKKKSGVPGERYDFWTEYVYSRLWLSKQNWINNNEIKDTDYLNILYELEQFCIQQKSYGFNLVLLGDFNADLQEISLHQMLNKRGLKLQEFCNVLNLIPANVSPVCENPQFTYISRTGNSVVDYVIIDDTLMQFFDSVERSCEHPDNTAFHLPLKLFVCPSLGPNFKRYRKSQYKY
jgi:hypothetical protein